MAHGPAYKHDCDSCQYLGAFYEDDKERRDLYYCPNTSLGGSYISRHGNEGSQYASFAHDVLVKILDSAGTSFVEKVGLKRAYEIVKERKES